MTRSDKASTNAKWTSNDDYRCNYAKVFGYKTGQKLEAFIEGFGIVDVVVLERRGDRYLIEALGRDFTAEIGWDDFSIG